MATNLVRLIVAAVLILTLSCGGSSRDAASSVSGQTLAPASATVIEATSTPAATATQTPAPRPTEAPFLQFALTRVDAIRPLVDVGSYLLDTETQKVWYLGQGGTWSPDGTAIAAGMCCVGTGEGITIMEIPSGAKAGIPAGDIISLAWSPDSQRIAFVAQNAQGEQETFVANRDGSGLRKLDDAGSLSTGRAEQLYWLDVATILYAKRQGLTDHTYFRVDIATGASVDLTPSNPPTANDPRILTGTASDDGGYVAYTDQGLYVWSAATGKAALIDPEGFGPAWSPDGSQLLFASMRDGEAFPFWRLYTVATNSTVDLPEVGMWAQWLADGRIIHDGWRCPTSAASGTSGNRDVTVFDPATSVSNVLTHTPDTAEYEAGVSPDGERIAYSTGDPAEHLKLIDVKTGAESEIASASAPGNPFHVHPANWSSDGRYLEFGYGFAHGICD